MAEHCNNHQEDKREHESCVTVTYQSAAVSVPVTVRPKVSTGSINTFCCGDPQITPSPYRIVSNPKSDGCSFVLTQNICVEIPIEFSAKAIVDCPFIRCGDVTGEVCNGGGG